MRKPGRKWTGLFGIKFRMSNLLATLGEDLKVYTELVC
jgi:hypothetical protein